MRIGKANFGGPSVMRFGQARQRDVGEDSLAIGIQLNPPTRLPNAAPTHGRSTTPSS